VYGERSARVMTPELRAGLTRLDPATAPDPRERLRVDRELVDAVDWRRVNLLDAGAVAALGAFDAILCRNVFIYFRNEVATRVVASLERALVDGGVLLVGASDSLVRLATNLSWEEHGGAFVYRVRRA
jgi:chemotaxis protein methyltransferase CheR